MKNGILLLNRVFKITITKLLVYTYIKTQLWINFIFMVYIIGLIFKAQINLMQFLKEFKLSEILCVVTLILLVLTQSVYTVPWKHSWCVGFVNIIILTNIYVIKLCNKISLVSSNVAVYCILKRFLMRRTLPMTSLRYAN
jgi:hypothetical protein